MEAKCLFFKYYDVIVGIVRRKSAAFNLDYDDLLNYVVENICQNNCRKISSFREESTFRTFLTIVVVNLVFSYYRHKKSTDKKRDSFVQDLVEDESTPAPEDGLESIEVERIKKEALEAIPDILRALPEQERETIELKYYQNYKISAIARFFKIKRHRVYCLLRRAQRRIRQQLHKRLSKYFN